ncbi:ribosome-binding protein 1-like isoform X2 [Planococcus citri]|uniref:ribosome-binding protein 1-like isoform X2 n=1 Tax=Planococcus citri TaxID=170843 RepID=UPI0031F94B78
MDLVSCVIPVSVIAISGLVVYYLFKVGLKEKTYEENAAEQKKKYGSKLKPKYPQQKKPSKVPTKEKTSAEKKPKVTFQNPVGKEIKKPEPPNISSAVDKPDGNASVKKKPEKVQPKPANPVVPNTNDKVQPVSNPSGKPNTEPLIVKVSANGTSDDATGVPDTLKNLSTSCIRNDTNNNIPVSKSSSLNESTDAEDTDSSYNNDRTNSISYYNSNTLNGEKLLKNKPSTGTGSDTETWQKSKSTEATSSAKMQPPQKKPKDDVVKSLKTDDKNKDKAKKTDEKAPRNAKETSVDKPKIPVSPSKYKKSEDKSKSQETAVVNSLLTPNNLSDEKEAKVKNDRKADVDKSTHAVGPEQNPDKKPSDEKESGCQLVKLEKTQPHKKNNASSNGGKTSPVQNGKQAANASKAAKRHTTEMKALQKITNENDGPVNVNLLMPLITKAELSRTEIQNLIDWLLNKQNEECISDAEWIEGSRQDPVAKLKKQLAEKEKLLTAEQEAHQAIQSKLKELRTELNVEKHTSRQLEETLNGRQVDLQSLNAKLQAALEEKQTFTKQLQQLQSQLTEERMMMHSLKEENAKTKSSLQQELLSQRQQLEVHIAQLNEQHQQAIVTLESQLGQMAAQLHEQEAANAQMSEELRECVMLREQIALQDNQIAHLRQTATATQELAIQLEELRAVRAELDRHLANSHCEVTRLSEQLARRNSEIDKFNSTVQNMKIENQELLKENARINEQINNAYSEKKQLQIDNEKLKDQLLQSREQSKSAQDIEQLENELRKYKTLVSEKTSEVTELNNQISELKASLQQSVSRNVELQKQNEAAKEIEDNFKKQLKKNDEIKVKEREELVSRLKGGFIPDTELNSNPVGVEDHEWFNKVEKWLKMLASSSSQQQQQQQQQQPRVPETSTGSPQRQLTNSTTLSVDDKVIPDAGQINMLCALEKQNTKLQSMVSHYKDIICDTEGMLNRLEQQVKQQENQWIKQIQALESKLESLSKEKELLSSQVKMQNGCSKEEQDVVDHKFKYENSNKDGKHAASILTTDSNVTVANS